MAISKKFTSVTKNFIKISPYLWMLIIFFLSSRQRLKVADEYVLNFLFFKTLHVIEYTILCTLLFLSNYISSKKPETKKSFKFAAIFTVAYAASDELHQTFVPTREGTLRDVGIDALGVFLVYSFLQSKIYAKFKGVISPLVCSKS